MPEESWSLVETKALSHNEIWWIWRPWSTPWALDKFQSHWGGLLPWGGFYFAWINVCVDFTGHRTSTWMSGAQVSQQNITLWRDVSGFYVTAGFSFLLIHFLLFLNLTISVFEGKVLDGSWLFPAFPVLMVNCDNWVPLVFNKTDTDHLIIIESIFSIVLCFQYSLCLILLVNASCLRLTTRLNYEGHSFPQRDKSKEN